MVEYHWCHGPSCHEKVTTDRVRGSKGSKVLRTRKVKTYNGNRGFYNWFCSQSCERDFCNKYTEQIVRIAPRLEPLETRIEDPKKIKHESDYVCSDGTRHTWTTTEIKKIDTISNVG